MLYWSKYLFLIKHSTTIVIGTERFIFHFQISHSDLPEWSSPYMSSSNVSITGVAASDVSTTTDELSIEVVAALPTLLKSIVSATPATT